MRIIIIAAIARNRVIGRSTGEMPWHLKEEFQHFKNTTFGSPVIMGRKTFQTLGKPLKGRVNIVITKNRLFNLSYKEVKIFESLINAIDFCRNEGNDKIFIIGGGEVYRQSLNVANEMILSHLDFEAEGDVLFPQFSEKEWKVVSRDHREKFEIVHYVKQDTIE